jgi:hypothetical protein
LQINFEDSVESQAVVLLAQADCSGGFAMRPRERRETSEQDPWFNVGRALLKLRDDVGKVLSML